MTRQPKNAAASTETSSFEWWYVAQFAFGAVHSGFLPILLPTYVISLTGKAADVGIVMGTMGVGAFLAPVIGSLADKYRAYRAAQLAGLASQAIAALVFAFSGDVLLLSLGGIFLGIGSATLMMINPTFVLGARFPQKVESRRLTRSNQTGRIGQLSGALAVAGLTLAGLSFSVRFLIMAGVPAGCLLLAALTNREAADRIKDTRREAVGAGGVSKVRLRNTLVSTFGLFLLAAICSRAALEMFWGQYPNYMQDVFQISPALSATALLVSALITLLILDLAGRWMGRSGPSPVWLAATGVPVFAAGVLILLALSVPVPALLPLGMYVILRLCMSWSNLTQPPLAQRMSPAKLGATQGILLVALIIGFMTGNISGGWLADAYGFQSIPWMVAALSIAALLLGYLAIKRRQSEHPEEALVSSNRTPPSPLDGDESVVEELVPVS